MIVQGAMKLSAVLQDGKAKSITKRFEVNPGHADMADAAAIVSANGLINLEAIRAKIEAVSQMSLQKFQLSVELTNDAATNGAGSHLDAAIATVDLETTGKKAQIVIPAPEDGIFIGDGAFGPSAETLDSADAGLQEFVALFKATSVDSVTDPEGVFLISDGEKLSDTTGIGGKKVK